MTTITTSTPSSPLRLGPPARAVGWVSVRCGEHDDHHASARINADLGAVKCLVCDFGGDVISVIRQKEQCNYREAVAIAQALTGDEHGDVRSQRGSGRAVPGSPRNRPADRRYSPPRLRSRSASGDEDYAGRPSIPYITPNGVVDHASARSVSSSRSISGIRIDRHGCSMSKHCSPRRTWWRCRGRDRHDCHAQPGRYPAVGVPGHSTGSRITGCCWRTSSTSWSCVTATAGRSSGGKW